MRNREVIQPRKIRMMVVDVFLLIADNNGNIVKVRYCESVIGVNRAWRVYSCYIKRTWENS